MITILLVMAMCQTQTVDLDVLQGMSQHWMTDVQICPKEFTRQRRSVDPECLIEQFLKGDVNFDGRVDLKDFAILSANWPGHVRQQRMGSPLHPLFQLYALKGLVWVGEPPQ